MPAGKARPRPQPEQRRWPEFPQPEALLEGLAVNPALPDGLLLRLIRDHGGPAATGLAERRSLPAAAVTAMAGHPEPWVRAALGANDAVPAEVRLRLLDDPDPAVRRLMEDVPGLALPDRVLRRVPERFARLLAAGRITEDELVGELAERMSAEPRLRPIVAGHPDPRLRMACCLLVTRLEPELREALRHDESAAIRDRMAHELAELTRPQTLADLNGSRGYRRAAILRGPLSDELLAWVLAEGDEYDLTDLAFNPHLPPEAVQALVTHREPAARRRAARRDDLTPEQALSLGADPDVEVRTEISVHPVLSEEQRAAIDADPDARYPNADYPEPGPERLAAWATSVSPHLRRRAAQDPRLPADLVKQLADDPDHEVRLELGHRHPDAPPETLLYAYLHLDRHARCCRPGMPDRPGFPAAGLARFAGDPRPHARLLAARDPAAGPDILERLLGDPDESVRWAAARSPHLPVRLIVFLLDDFELRGSAAANPALPVAEMARRIASPDVAVTPVADHRRGLVE
ncbi:hypothetical protein [Actinoplanes sp. L3-i22]|uniref:hypothetical protein n=1 Tax=Actinoplanes sp. L3-i22 TaxID=2836373 RepID=UPI001C765EBD|nr:hypothetical protein [Actinoplanes sp. L3-i22]BCY13475.1 hypothetical protein L3i22_085630 [Actinoplanes sp. L3-i22]